MPIRETITTTVMEIAKDQKVNVKPLQDDLVLLNSGLDSLCFAILVARLEDRLGFDPFAASEDTTFPVTLGDFIRLYEHAAA